MSFVKLIIRMYNSAHSTAQRWANAERSINESVLGDRIQIQIEKHKTLAKSRHTAEWTGLEYDRTETQNKVIKWNIKESEGIVIYFGGSFHLTVIWIFLVDFYVFLGFFLVCCAGVLVPIVVKNCWPVSQAVSVWCCLGFVFRWTRDIRYSIDWCADVRVSERET